MAEEIKTENQPEVSDPVVLSIVDKIVEETKNLVGEVGTIDRIILRNGTEYPIPEFDMKRDLAVVQWFGNALKNNTEFLNAFLDIYKTLSSINFNFEQLKNDQEKFLDFIYGLLVKNVPTLLMNIPDLFLQITCIVLKQDVNWINSNIDIDKALTVIPPFILKRQQYRNSLKIVLEWVNLKK